MAPAGRGRFRTRPKNRVVEMEVAAVEHVAQMTDMRYPAPARPWAATWSAGLADGASQHLVRLLPFLPGRTAAPEELDRTPCAASGR